MEKLLPGEEGDDAVPCVCSDPASVLWTPWKVPRRSGKDGPSESNRACLCSLLPSGPVKEPMEKLLPGEEGDDAVQFRVAALTMLVPCRCPGSPLSLTISFLYQVLGKSDKDGPYLSKKKEIQSYEEHVNCQASSGDDPTEREGIPTKH